MKSLINQHKPESKTKSIFQLTTPYNNPYQGSSPKLLFCCSVGLLRSPTAANEAIKLGYNARSCGTDVERALIPISANLIVWADKIIFINKENYDKAVELFEKNYDGFYDYRNDIEPKSIIWGIEDEYNYNSKELVWNINERLKSLK